MTGVHPTAFIGIRCKVHRDIIMREHSFMNQGCRIGPCVELGRYVMLGPEVAVVGADHRIDVPGVPAIFSGRPPMRKTVIEDDVWIGFRVTVLAGVRIGRGAVIAAGAVVSRDVPPLEIHAGIPNSKLRARFEGEELRAHMEFLDGGLVSGEPCQRKSASPNR